MADESEYQGYPILILEDRFWVGDRDFDDVDSARACIDEGLVGSDTTPGRIRALFRLHHETQRGDTLLYYCDVAITIEDDDRGWTYNVGHYQTRNLEEVMDYAEAMNSLNPVDRRTADRLAKFARDEAEEYFRRLMGGESLDPGEECSEEKLLELVHSILEAGG